MANGIGPSTNESTATMRNDVSGSAPASFRYNNPGAQHPSTEAARFGQTGFGIIGGGHKIARFSSPVNGAASNFDLLNRKYTGITIGAAGTKWTGAYGFGVPGYDPNSMLTPGTTPPKVDQPDIVYEPGAPNMEKEIIFKIQLALAVRGFDPGEIDGDYGPNTQAAVADFQRASGLAVDGAVGPETAEALGISLVAEEEGPVQPGNGGDGLGSNPLLSLILGLLGSTGRPTADGPARPGQDIDYLQLLLPLLQATPAGAQIQIAELLLKLLTGRPLGSPTLTPQPSPMPTDVGSLLSLLLQLLGGRR